MNSQAPSKERANDPVYSLVAEAREWLQYLVDNGVSGHSILKQLIERLDNEPAPALDFVAALKIAEGVFEQYRQDQLRWWKKMDGTPILNDVAVRMAEAFRKAVSSDDTLMLRSVGAMAIAEGEEGWERVPIDCPMLAAVAKLRRDHDTLRAGPPPLPVLVTTDRKSGLNVAWNAIESPKCPECGGTYFSHPRLGISHYCQTKGNAP